MCLIIDANLAATFFTTDDPKYKPVRDAVFSGRCCIYYGGKLKDELGEVREAARNLLALDRAGRAKALSNTAVNALETKIRDQELCESDDEHIIALAQLSGARLLCSNDRLLRRDFKNPALLNKPRGNIYSNPSHRALLKVHCKAC
jgi:hypothetical protein